MSIKAKFLVLFLLLSGSGIAQSAYWQRSGENKIRVEGKRQIIPQKYITYQLNLNELNTALASAPSERAGHISQSKCVIQIPSPAGKVLSFRVVESPVMAKELAASFPQIRTYSIKGIDDESASGKIDLNDFGFHAMVFSAEGDYFIDPYSSGNTESYIVYYTRDFKKDEKDIIPEAGLEKSVFDQQGQKKSGGGSAAKSPPMCVGDQIKTYRLAVACTGEYAVAATNSATPTLAQTLSRVVTTVNRVDGVYEKDLAIRLELVPSTTLVLYTNGATDSFTGTANNNAILLIGLSQTIITNSVGTANFDIGHTFSTGGGGLANLGCVCNPNQKARGITGSSNPVGDPYDIDYVAHEMGHQFGGNHTFNAITSGCNGNREPSAAVEPGSGVTIMAYAGLCGQNNLAANSIPYMHARSYDEILNYTTFGGGSQCGSLSNSGNQPPVVTGSGNYVVPKNTPFILTGTGIDPDGDPLTFSWEENDPGPAAGNWNSGSKPFFRSYAPVATPVRLFPRFNVVQSGNYTGTPGEYLPQSAQTLNFRLTARDGLGGVCFATSQVEVDSSGPFIVTYPSAPGITWLSGSQQQVSWNPNFTDQPPVSCDSVRILISLNSGITYSVIHESAANFGWQTITAPNLSTTVSTCRIRVEARGNIFYDISNNDFTISPDPYVGVGEMSRNNSAALSIWPNPAQNELHLTLVSPPESNTRVSVSNLLGQTVLEKDYHQSGLITDILSIDQLAPGVYLLSAGSGNNQSVQRFVVDR